jgi:hypothetical protein
MQPIAALFSILAALAAPAGQAPVLSSHGTAIPASAASPAPGAAAGAGLAFDLPAAWVRQTPSSSMRLAQASIPGAAGPGQFAIFFFGPGGGGGAEVNINRWVEQIAQPVAPPHRETFTTAGLKVTWVDVAGTMKPSAVGMGPSTAQPHTRVLGAVVEGPGGPWFAKVYGPDATVAAARGAFLAVLHGMRPRS